MSEVDGYVPWDPRRLCDTCGDWYRLSHLTRLPGNVWSCNDKCVGERSAVELSRANASQRPFLYRPVKNAKPEDPNNPDTFEADDGAILNFVARMVAATTRYESVVSGVGAPVSGDSIAGMAWAARYLYNVISDDKRSSAFIARAEELLASCADYLLTRQYGSPTGPTAGATAYNGGVIDPGTTVLVTNDVAVAGQAFLYAYRVFGTAQYIVSARAAAGYLRNVQAIGSCATNFTSRDAPGTVRLYTGSLCSEVSTSTFVFYSNHQFYPSALVVLEFWNELLTTDGDQTVGSDGIVSGFDIDPSQLLSESISDLRACWTNGIEDADGVTINGLSSTTPREFFNAYPELKVEFSDGTGMWEFADGNASTGTTVTGINFAQALSSLYAYEGASAQVAAIDTWMYAFSSNADYETPDDTSDYTLARSDTGTYDPTMGIATALLVRDPDASYAAIAENGSIRYDWGAFGLLSALWSVRHGTFAEARRSACGVNFRYDDGNTSDGLYKDRITLRGQCGLSYQTSFSIPTYGQANDVVKASQFGLSLRQAPRSITPPPS